MIHAFFYLVAPGKVSAFESMFREGGIYRELSRHLQPSLITIDLFRSLELKTAFVTLEFWQSEEAYLKAQSAPAQPVLTRFLQKMSIACLDIGSFTSPLRMDNANQWQEVSTTFLADCIKERGFEDA